jgi:hypothetical protein
MLLVLMRVIYDVRQRDGLRWHDLCIPSFMKICEGFMMYAVEVASCGMIYLPSSMRSGKGIQAILRFCISNLNGYNIGITVGRELWCTPLK